MIPTMKHSLYFGAFAAAVFFAFACTEQELPVNSPSSSGRKILVKATQEAFSADTKLVLSESGETFTLNWENEGFTLFNTSDPSQQSLFSMVSCSGTTASFSGELPELEDETTTYVAVVAPAAEVSITDERQYVYGQIPAVQTYVEGGIGANAFLVARQADTDAGTLDDLEFKTMNSFIGFSLKKGAAASGSSNTYDEMYVTEIQVASASGSVSLAGRFSLDIASDSWDEAYMTVKSSSKVITLDCSAAGDGKGVALSADEATDFYLTTCFGTITGGLKVTFTVSNGEGQTGKMVRYIGKNSSIVLYRNNLLKMPALTVNPTDYVDRYDEWIGDWVLNGVNVTISEMVHGSTLRLQSGAVSLTLQYNDDGTVASVTPLDGAPAKVRKRIVDDFDASYYPTAPVVPSTEIVHDRISLEVFRGCIRGCRFCQAGHICRPVRNRAPETLMEQGKKSLESTGYQELNLSSLSTSDYRGLSDLCDGLLEYCEPRGISLSLPSLRADNFSMDIMQRVQRVRKSGLTFAPEAGTQRMRDVINKNVTEEELLESCRVAFSGGWNGVKLYFMLGLPTETDEDVRGIAELAKKVLWCWKQNASNKSRGVRITVSTSEFIPKPHTPFQWEEQVTREEYLRRVHVLTDALASARAITYNWHDAEVSLIEAALARGDRRLGAVIEEVWRQGGRLESWTEYFSLQRWLDAFVTCGLDPEFYALRERPLDELLPWEHMDMGVTRRHYERERERAYRSELSPDCRAACSGCGAASLLKEGVCRG